MSADRLFQMVYLLLERGRLTAGQLAEKLEVSVRTVYRDVDALSAAGVPICTTQGQGGGVSLMDGFVLDRAAFTEEEQCQLLSALRALPAVGDGAALTKLSALFRQGGQEGWLQVHLSRWGDCHGDDALFNALRQAILGRRAIAFRYASSQGLTLPRRALPARLVYKGQGWYLQALDLDREDYRTFRLTRILDLTVTDRQFHRQLSPPDIDFDGEIPPLFRLECVLRFSPALAWRVYDEFDRDCVTTLADGRLEVRAVFPEDQWLYGYLLSFGAGVEIVAPDDLRRRMALLGREIYQVHGEPDTPCQVCCGTMGPSKQKEVPTMKDLSTNFCQSCGMPLAGASQHGTEADGTPSPDYCAYCYQQGRFVGDMTMEEMIDFCTPHMVQANTGMTEQQAREQMYRFFPQLKRWRK